MFRAQTHSPMREAALAASFLRWQFADEGPGDLGHLAVVVVDKESVPQFLVQFDALHDGLGGDPIGLAYGLVRFQEAEAIVELDRKGVFPLVVAGVFEAGELPLAKGGLEWVEDFHNLPSVTSCRIISTTFLGGFQSSSGS